MDSNLEPGVQRVCRPLGKLKKGTCFLCSSECLHPGHLWASRTPNLWPSQFAPPPHRMHPHQSVWSSHKLVWLPILTCKLGIMSVSSKTVKSEEIIPSKCLTCAWQLFTSLSPLIALHQFFNRLAHTQAWSSDVVHLPLICRVSAFETSAFYPWNNCLFVPDILRISSEYHA